MPWRGAEQEGEFPTLGYLVADWIEAKCAIPDGDQAGEPFILTDEQLRFILFFYRLRLTSKPKDKPASAFTYRRGQLVRPQKWGKGPLSSAIICAEADGPVVFDGWDSAGDPVGRPWATPWIQVTAVSEDQTDNVWSSLQPMIELGDIAADIPDTGLTRIFLPGGGRIEPVTSAAVSRLGQKITFSNQDETHSWTQRNGGTKLADTQRRNLAGMGGRSLETTNAWDPSEESVAQTTFEAKPADVLIDYPEPRKGSIRNKQERRRALRHAYSGAPWVDLDRISAEIEELLPRDPNQAERFFLNRIVAGADHAFDLEVWNPLAKPELVIEPKRLITLGFDGSQRQDSTGLVATDIELGHQFVLGVWERPVDARADDWVVPLAEVHEAVAHAFDTWNVWRLAADPPYWETPIDEWAGKYGEQRVIQWWTHHRKKMAYALKAWHGAMRPGELSHDGSEALARHIGNAVKANTKIRDEDDGSWLWIIHKETPKSPRKIDLAMAACLSWEARGDAIRAGVLDEPDYGSAQW